MSYYIKNPKNELLDILLKLSYISYNNVKWSCLYSGAGILHILSDKELRRISHKFKDRSGVRESLKDVALLKCIYKKGKPIFSVPPDEILNPGSYMWDYASFNKIITPSSQAMGILALLKSAEINYEDDSLASYLMVSSAENYYDFLTTYLRNDSGLFVSVENKTKYIQDELKIKIDQKEAKLLEQVFVHEAFLHLYKTTSNEKFKEFYDSKNDKYYAESKCLFTFIFENYNHLLEASTKDISYTISSLSRCCKLNTDTQQTINYQHLIALLCAELESRIKINGEIEKSITDSTPASIVTHFRAASALLHGYMETNIDKFKDLAHLIYSYLSDLYDSSLGLYLQGDYNKLKYSIRDIADVFTSLLNYYYIFKDDSIVKTLEDFYASAVESSGILESIASSEDVYLGNNINFNNLIPLSSDTGRAPVFLKSFRMNFKKTTTVNISKHFNSFYSLYASYLFLNLIDMEYCEEKKPIGEEPNLPEIGDLCSENTDLSAEENKKEFEAMENDDQ